MKDLTRLEAEQRIDAIDAEISRIEAEMKGHKFKNSNRYLIMGVEKLKLQYEKDQLLQITN